MSGTHRFNTNYRAEEAGKVVFKHCKCVIDLPKRYVEQMSDKVKSLGWILQLLSSLRCFSEAVLLVFIHSPQKSKKKSAWHSNALLSSLSQISQTLISGFAYVSIKILLQTLKLVRFPPIPFLLIQSSSALFHAEKLALRVKNCVGISKYKPFDYERLQAIIDAKRLETDALGEKVN